MLKKNPEERTTVENLGKEMGACAILEFKRRRHRRMSTKQKGAVSKRSEEDLLKTVNQHTVFENYSKILILATSGARCVHFLKYLGKCFFDP